MAADTIAIVAAGGTGSRVRADRPKQFLELLGKPLLAHTITRFVESPDINRIVVVLPHRDFERHIELMSPWFAPGGELSMVPGGESRQESVWNGLSTIPPSFEGCVLVHDGARPLVSHEIIGAVVAAGKRFGGAIAALPVDETLKQVGPDDVIVGTLDRGLYYRAQTPQCFRHRILRMAFERARADDFRGTDEAQLVERIGEPVHLVTGSVRNIKVTTPEHLSLVEHYLTMGPRS